jgi:hypothetical protein
MTGEPGGSEGTPDDRAPAATDDELDLDRRRLSNKGTRDDLVLRKRVANGILGLMVIQIAAADYIFYLYGTAWEWRIPTAAINGWLTATVVQIVSVVLVITRYLFPKDGFRD